MNLVSKVVEIQIPFDHGEAYFSPAINQCQLPEIYQFQGSPHLLPVTLPPTEQMTHKLKLNKVLCKDFLPLGLLKVSFD